MLLDRFLDDAIEVDVDAVSDGERVYVGGIMEHIEQAGVHSGDSACSLPPFSLDAAIQDELATQTRRLARALEVVGLMNIQFAIQNGEVYLLEVNPRASRTAPFVSKATGVPLARLGVHCKLGRSLDSQGVGREVVPEYFSVKEAVFPFVKFPGVDSLLGPEMKSTGEVMGIGRRFSEAFAKATAAAGDPLPQAGTAFLSVRDRDKPELVDVASGFLTQGFHLVATHGTAKFLTGRGIECQRVNKVTEGRPHVVDLIEERRHRHYRQYH